ncbi:MAG: nucleoside-diphosphate-sugar epimerase [Gemmatimonadetes bacterium]|nr:nucleoside-diphosphate-sugar epimerase [Gemmatimonadota bacterium]
MSSAEGRWLRRLPDADLDHVLTYAGSALASLRGARLLVTGGTGFVGSWLLESLAYAVDRKGAALHATVLTRDPEAFAARAPWLASHAAITLHRGDIRSFTAPAAAITHVIHAATPASAALNASHPGEMLATIAEGTRHLLHVAHTIGARRVLLLSSGAVYGVQPPELPRVDEDYRGGPDVLDTGSAYAEGKRFAELLGAIASREHGLEVAVARLFAFVGPHLPLDTHFAVGNFMRDGLAGGPIRVGGDGTPYRSYLHAADLAAWLWVLLASGVSGRAYNVGSEEAVNIADLARTVSRAAGGIDVTVAREPVPGRPAARYVPSCARARAELALDVRIPLADAVARTLAWHRLGA